ncbi:MAG: hypothetical protein FWE74_01160 [Oscillospiraceae bacterium]|nr:hypothetical protein [Oscillospiraceae bacterium]
MKDLFDGLLINYIKTTDVKFDERIEEIEQKLKKSLNEEEHELLLDYANAHFDYIHSRSVENFKQGFWTGFEIRGDLMEY